ncbi:hypothetical protein C6Y44_09940 [Rhodococcus rhodochrous]|nr:hypothetical protein C6Y44_09940 [Rhodococcus rhodochrous]
MASIWGEVGGVSTGGRIFRRIFRRIFSLLTLLLLRLFFILLFCRLIASQDSARVPAVNSRQWATKDQ